MKDEHQASEEVIKEYPNVTYWLEGRRVLGMGNLILTNERLIFLNRVVISEWQTENIRKLAREGATDKLIEFGLALHKKNFQISLPAVIAVKLGLYSLLPFPRVCMRIYYKGAKKKIKTTSFLFRIPLLKGLVQFDITTTGGWIIAINKAVKAKKSTA